MSLIDQLDRKFRRFGIPALLRTVGLLQVIVYILLVVRPHAFDLLTLNPEAVKNGEIWRVFTFCLIPQTQSIIWMIFSVWMLFWVGDALESEWGPFRVTLYYFSTVALLAVAAWHGSPQNGAIGRMTDDGHLIILKTSSHYLYLSVFLAFCVTFPRRTINLYGILPIQAAWLGWLDAAFIAFEFYGNQTMRLAIGLSMIPFLMLAGPVLYYGMKLRSKVWKRREEFEANRLPEQDFFHACVICKRNDQTHPELEFRVMSDDNEYCLEHLPKK